MDSVQQNIQVVRYANNESHYNGCTIACTWWFKKKTHVYQNESPIVLLLLCPLQWQTVIHAVCVYTLVSRVSMASLKVSSDRPWGPARAKKRREREETLINMQHLFTYTNFQQELMESINNNHYPSKPSIYSSSNELFKHLPSSKHRMVDLKQMPTPVRDQLLHTSRITFSASQVTRYTAPSQLPFV